LADDRTIGKPSSSNSESDDNAPGSATLRGSVAMGRLGKRSTHAIKSVVDYTRAHNGVIGAVAGVLGTGLAFLAFLQVQADDSPEVETASFTIDRPENIEQSIFDYGEDDGDPPLSVGKDEDVTYVVDVTVQNKGGQSALITEVAVEFTSAFVPEQCGVTPTGGGGGLFLGASYDIEVNDSFLSSLPVTKSKSTRLEVPAREYTRFDVTIGSKEKPPEDMVYVFAFDMYVIVAGSEVRVLIGQGKAVSSTEDANDFVESIPAYARASPECMKANAEGIKKIAELPGETSPALNNLVELTAMYR